MKNTVLLLTLIFGQYCFAGPVISEGPVIAPPYKERMTACFNTQIQDRCEIVSSSALKRVRTSKGPFYDLMVVTACGPNQVTEHFYIQYDRGPAGCKVTQLTESFIPQD